MSELSDKRYTDKECEQIRTDSLTMSLDHRLIEVAEARPKMRELEAYIISDMCGVCPSECRSCAALEQAVSWLRDIAKIPLED
mgnify:CR=1 FL=1